MSKLSHPIRRLKRPRSGGMISGVSVALANYFRIDVTLVRIVWVLLVLPGGLPGIIPYLVLWALIPKED